MEGLIAVSPAAVVPAVIGEVDVEEREKDAYGNVFLTAAELQQQVAGDSGSGRRGLGGAACAHCWLLRRRWRWGRGSCCA